MPSVGYVRQAAELQRRRRRRAWGPGIRTEPLTVTFPTTPLRSRCWIALGADLTQSYLSWNWLDITEYVRWEQGIAIAAARRDQSDRVDASVARLTLENDGRFSRKNPLGPHYGLLTRHTPIWLALDPGTGYADRYFGFVNEWPKRWDRSGEDSTVDIVCGGIMRRHQRSQPLPSPSRATIASAAPLAYWHLEDGEQATQFASGILGGSPLTFTGSPAPGSVQAFDGSRPVALFEATGDTSSASFTTDIVGATAGFLSISYHFIATLPSPTVTSLWDVLKVEFSGGTITERRINTYAGTTGGVRDDFEAIEIATVAGTFSTDLDPWDGEPHTVHVRMQQDGSDVDYELWVDGELLASATEADTLGTPVRLFGPKPDHLTYIGDDSNNTGGSITMGHVVISDDPDALDAETFHSAATAWVGEQAHERIARLCRENGLSILCHATTSAALGPQPQGNLLDVLRHAEKADQGVLYEHQFGYGYQALSERYNRPVRLELDIAEGHLTDELEPDDSDLRFRNQWTARRTDGSEATKQARNGISGIELDATEALYDAEDTFGVETDSQLGDIAGWLAHRDSLDDDYWPNVAFSLAKHPELITTWLELGYGERMTVDNVMSQAGVDQLDLIIEGYTEYWNSKQWEVVLNTSPASVFRVLQLDDDALGRIDSSSSALAASAAQGATSLFVVTTNPVELWTTDSAEFPLNVEISGIEVEVTAINSGVRDTYTRTEAAGSFGTSDSGHTYELSGTATDFSVNGSQGVIAPTAVNSERHATVDFGLVSAQGARIWCTLPDVPTGAPINWGLLLRYADASNYLWADVQVGTDSSLTLRLIKRVGGVATQITTAAAPLRHSTTVPRVLRAEYSPSDGLYRARVWSSDAAEPIDMWHVSTTDTVVPAGTRVGAIGRLMTGNTNVSPQLQFDNFALLSPQTFTVTGATVTKALSAGDEVHVADPVVLGV